MVQASFRIVSKARALKLRSAMAFLRSSFLQSSRRQYSLSGAWLMRALQVVIFDFRDFVKRWLWMERAFRMRSRMTA